MKPIPVIKSELTQFSGSQTFTRYNPILFPGVILTEGAVYVAEECGAYWLMDIIGSYQMLPRFKKEDFQVFKLAVTGTKAELVVEDGNENVINLSENPHNQELSNKIEFTDFPLPSITLWAVRNELGGVTVMLPSEY